MSANIQKPLLNTFLQGDMRGNDKRITGLGGLEMSGDIDMGGNQLIDLDASTIFFPVFRVQDYGAVGDGVTDDTAAINAAFTAAKENTNYVVEFEPKEYLIDTQSTVEGIATAIPIEDGAVKSNIVIRGNGARLKTTLVSGCYFQISTFWDNMVIDGFVFDRADDASTPYPTDAIWLNSSFGTFTSPEEEDPDAPTRPRPSSLIIQNCTSINCQHLITTPDGGIMARKYSLRLFKMLGCTLLYPYATNQSANGRPGQCVYLNNWVHTAIFEDNYNDGSMNDLTGYDYPYPKDGFLYVESLHLYARRNVVKNFWVEGIMHITQTVISSIIEAWTMPAVNDSVVVSINPDTHAENLTTLLTDDTYVFVYTQDASVRSRMQVVSRAGFDLILKNVGGNTDFGPDTNAAPTTVMPGFSFIAAYNPDDDWLTVIEDNSFDQRRVIDGPPRGNPCVAALAGYSVVRNNTMNNVAWGVRAAFANGGVFWGQFGQLGAGSIIEGNTIRFDEVGGDGWIVGEDARAGILGATYVKNVRVANNHLYSESSRGVLGIQGGQDWVVEGNTIVAATKGYEVSDYTGRTSIALAAPTDSSTNCLFKDNHVRNFYFGMSPASDGGSQPWRYSGFTWYNVTYPTPGQLNYDVPADISEAEVSTFFPTSAGWYRLVISTNNEYMGGVLTVRCHNGVMGPTEICVHYAQPGYGQQGSIQQVRDAGFYGAGQYIDQVRVSSSGPAAYLDIHITTSGGVDSEVGTGRVYVYNQGPYKGNAVVSPSVGAMDEGGGVTLTLGRGFRSTEATLISSLVLSDVPTADPEVEGAVWSDSGILTISDGPVSPPADEIAPEFVSATVNVTGDQLTLVFTEAVEAGTDLFNTFVLESLDGDVYPTYASGTGTDTLVFTLSATILVDQVFTMIYSQPGDGVQDLAANLLESATDFPVTNNSAET